MRKVVLISAIGGPHIGNLARASRLTGIWHATIIEGRGCRPSATQYVDVSLPLSEFETSAMDSLS